MPGRRPPRSPARRVAGSFVWMVSAAALACGDAADGGGTPSEVTVRDSSGVEIVENSIPEEPPLAFVASDAPSLAIGALGGDETQQLHRVQDALRLPDGRIAVLNSGSHEVRIYGADGTLDLAFGRQGDGPSEFTGFPSQLEFLPPARGLGHGDLGNVLVSYGRHVPPQRARSNGIRIVRSGRTQGPGHLRRSRHGTAPPTHRH